MAENEVLSGGTQTIELYKFTGVRVENQNLPEALFRAFSSNHFTEPRLLHPGDRINLWKKHRYYRFDELSKIKVKPGLSVMIDEYVPGEISTRNVFELAPGNYYTVSGYSRKTGQEYLAFVLYNHRPQDPPFRALAVGISNPVAAFDVMGNRGVYYLDR